MEGKLNLPDIYVVSKFATLPVDLKIYLPETVKVISVSVPGLQWNKYDIVEIPESTMGLLRNAEVLVTDSHCLAGLMYQLPGVKWVQNTLAGVELVFDELDHSKPLPRFTLTRYCDPYIGSQLANYVLAQIINIERKLYDYHDEQKLKKWSRPKVSPNHRILSDLTIGILGAGMMGSAVGTLLKKTGSRVIAFARSERNAPSEDFDLVVSDLDVILSESDYICNVLPSTQYTRGLLDNDVLRGCKKKPVFINVGRGDVMRDTSLIKALKEGWISQAVLDVFQEEPLPPENQLWSVPKVYITPHIGAMPKTEGIAQFVAENYMRYVRGDALMNVVSWEKGY